MRLNCIHRQWTTRLAQHCRFRTALSVLCTGPRKSFHFSTFPRTYRNQPQPDEKCGTAKPLNSHPQQAGASTLCRNLLRRPISCRNPTDRQHHPPPAAGFWGMGWGAAFTEGGNHSTRLSHPSKFVSFCCYSVIKHVQHKIYSFNHVNVYNSAALSAFPMCSQH